MRAGPGVFVLLGLAACGADEPTPAVTTDRPSTSTSATEQEAVRVFFQVKALSGSPGLVSIRLIDPDGAVVEKDVEVPWTSEEYSFAGDQALSMTASAENDDGYLQCDGLTDQGPYGRVSGSSGQGACKVDVTLTDLGDRSGP